MVISSFSISFSILYKHLIAAPLALKTIEILDPIKDFIHTITANNEKEFAKHQKTAKDFTFFAYICKPFDSWERILVK